MNAFAFALSGIWGGFGASGLCRAARAWLCAIMDANASDPTPQKQSERNSRRFRENRMCSGISVHIQKRVEVEHGQGEFLHAGRIVWTGTEVFDRERFLLGGGKTPCCQPPGMIDAFGNRRALLEETLGEQGSQLV